MDPGIVAAIISAVASIVVALVSRPGAGTSKQGSRSVGKRVEWRIPRRHVVAWFVGVPVLGLGLLAMGILGHHDLAGAGGFFSPLVLWAFAVFMPIRPIMSVSAMLLLTPFIFLGEPLSKMSKGMAADNHFEPGAFAFYLVFAAVSAGITWGLCAWRARKYRQVMVEGTPHDARSAVEAPVPTSISARPPTSELARGLAELARLHEEGVLSDDEFAAAKQRLIAGD